MRDRIESSHQAVAQRHVEHVVGGCTGSVTGAAGVVLKGDLETAQTWLVGRENVDAAARIVLAVQRKVVLEDEYRQLGGRIGAGFRHYCDGLAAVMRALGDGSAAHAVSACAVSRSSGGAVERRSRVAGDERLCRIAWQHRDVVALVGIQATRRQGSRAQATSPGFEMGLACTGEPSTVWLFAQETSSVHPLAITGM